MSSTIRIGLIGLGRHGMRYAQHLTAGDVPGATLAAVWTRDPTKRAAVAQQHGVTPAATLTELTERDLDAVIAAVPAGMHLEVVQACAQAGRPLLLEKPLARTGAEGLGMCEAMEAANAPFMVAQTLRFDPLVLALRDRVPSLGRLTGLSFEQRLEPRGLAWEDDPEVSGGGVFMQTAIHTLDAARFITQAVESRVICASTDRVHYANNEDVGLVHLSLGGGPHLNQAILADVRVSKIGGSRHMRFALFGTEGGLEADFIDRCLIHTVGRSRTVETMPELPTVPTVTAAFVQSLLRNQPCPVLPRDALESLRLVEEAYDRARLTKRP